MTNKTGVLGDAEFRILVWLLDIYLYHRMTLFGVVLPLTTVDVLQLLNIAVINSGIIGLYAAPSIHSIIPVTQSVCQELLLYRVGRIRSTEYHSS